MDEITQKINTPKDLKDYKGNFVVFFSEEESPSVLFNSYIAEEAYKAAEKIKQKTGKAPIVYRVQDSNINITAKLSY